MPICLLSLCILSPLLSLDSHCSAKCCSIQGSFHVPVTLLELRYRIAGDACSFRRWQSWAPLLCLYICASLIECLLYLFVCVWTSAGCAKIFKHVFPMYILVFTLYVCSTVVTGMSNSPNVFVSTRISACGEHGHRGSEAERTHFQSAVLPRCLSAEQ